MNIENYCQPRTFGWSHHSQYRRHVAVPCRAAPATRLRWPRPQHIGGDRQHPSPLDLSATANFTAPGAW